MACIIIDNGAIAVSRSKEEGVVLAMDVFSSATVGTLMYVQRAEMLFDIRVRRIAIKYSGKLEEREIYGWLSP